MKHKFIRRFAALMLLFALGMMTLTACSDKTKDEGGKGDSLSDGIDGSSENSSNGDEVPGTNLSDSIGEGNDVEGDDTPATVVTATVITEEEIRSMVQEALKVNTLPSIYDEAYQNEVSNQLEQLKQKQDYTQDEPLFVMNPYGTNRCSMYVYLDTEDDVFMEYTISVDSQVVSDFTRHMYTNDKAESSSHHEGQVVGLVPGVTNTITFRSYDTGNKITDKYVYTIDLPVSETITDTILDVKQVRSLEELSDGLFALFGYDRANKAEASHILFYDNTGVVRGEIPLEPGAADSRIEFVDECILYPCSENQFALVNQYGKVTHVYTLDGFRLHHDFDYDADEDCILTLATNEKRKTQQDSIVLLDLQSGNYAEVCNMSDLLSDISKRAITTNETVGNDGIGWIQLNSIQIIDTDNVIVSSRELSSIIKIDDIKEEPEIEYIIGDPSIWNNTAYSNLVLKQSGEFPIHAGQYSVSYMKDNTLEDGQYYIHMHNNNYGDATSYPEFDFASIEGVGRKGADAENSYYYRYMVDENAKTVKLEDSFKVPYSKLAGSTQDIDGNHIVSSGSAGVFGEYDKDGNLIAEYKLNADADIAVYRVFKYKMDGYWFN